MIAVLKDSHPVAATEHTCMLCGCKINKGQRYYRQTCKYEDDVYDFIEHEECKALAKELDMYDESDRTIIDDVFISELTQYIHDVYPPKDVDQFENMSYYDMVCRILKDLKKGEQSDGED